jgi:hypothetical protein
MFGRALCLAVAVVLAGAGEALAQKQTEKAPPRERAQEFYRLPLLRGADRAAKVTMAEVAESEPNDDATSADAVSLGDQGTGEVNPAGDADYWVFSVTAGTTIDIDVDARAIGSPLDPTLELFDTDGTTSLAYNDDSDGLDSRIVYTIDVTGSYYIAIRAFANGGGSGQFYTINFNFVEAPDVNESEPNDDATSADAVSLGDRAGGEVNPAGDIDYWVFSVTAGTTLDIDVDASQFGSPLDPTLELFDTDGTTSLAFNDDSDGLDSRILYTIDVTGSYYIAIRAFANGGGPGEVYTINFNIRQDGPGDPVAPIATNLSGPLGVAAGSDGDLYVSEAGMDRILRVTTAGNVSVFASGVTLPLSLAFDASGDLLVVSDYAVVYKVTPQGQVSTFLTDADTPFWVIVGPDGDIWLSDLGPGTIRHYDQHGAFIESIDVSSVGGAGPIAFAPTGELYFSTGAEMYRLVGGQPQSVFTSAPTMWGFSFDVNGNIYLPNPDLAKLILFDINGTVLEDPFVIGVVTPIATAFGRNPDGTTNARLFVTDIEGGRLVEVNPAGVLAPGWPVGVQAWEYTAYLDLDQIDAAPGEAFEVPLVLESKDGSDLPVAAYQSELNWQPAELNYLANRVGDFGGAYVANETGAGQGVFGAAAARATDVGVPLTTLFWLTYELDASLEPGQCTDISIRFDELSGEGGEDYLSKLGVETPVSIGLGQIQGDVTGDGAVSVADVVMILRWLVDLPICEGCEIGKGDADCDGVVDSSDAVVMLRWLIELPVGDACIGEPRIGPCLQ